MELEPRLRAFAAVARQGSFSRAAAAMHVSQPAISKHIAVLEAELGVPLVERNRNGARLTREGRVLADYVLRAEALLANAGRAVAATSAESGTVTVAASGIPGDYLLPGLLARFLRRFPAVDVKLEVTTSARALDLVRSHEVELGVVGGFTPPDELEVAELVTDEIVLVAPPHLAGRRIRPKDLERLTWITRDEGSSTRAAVEAARWQLGVHEPRALELGSWEAVKRAIAAGAGIAAISRYAVEVELAEGTLASLDVRGWQLRRVLSLVTPRDVPLTPAARLFIEVLRQSDFKSPRREAQPSADDLARHTAEYLAHLVEDTAPHVLGEADDERVQRLLGERNDIDAAVDWAAAQGDHRLVVRLLGPCWKLWLAQGYPASWRQHLGEAEAALEDARLRLLALPTLGWLALEERDLEQAERYANERLSLGRELGDDAHAGAGLSMLAAIAEARGDLAAARRLGEEAVAFDRRAGDHEALVAHLSNLAGYVLELGDLDASEELVREMAAIAREHGQDVMIGRALFHSAMTALIRGSAAEAFELAVESLRPSPLDSAHNRWAEIELLGASLVGIRAAAPGTRLLGASEALRAPLGDRRPEFAARLRAAALDQARRQLGEAAIERELARGASLSGEEALLYARRVSSGRLAARRSSTPGASRSASNRGSRARR